MNISRIALPLFSLAALFALFAECVCAEDRGPQKFLSWNYYGSATDEDSTELGPIVTDRPDFTESPATVGYGVVQLETGYTYTYDSDSSGSTRSHSFPQSLFRIGMLAEWFELRIDWNYADNRVNNFGGGIDTISGGEDLGIGCKFALTEQECILPETGLILQMSVPTGERELSANRVLPGVGYLYGWELNEKVSLGGETQLNLSVDDESNGTYTEFAQSLTSGYGWTENLHSFFEWYVLAPSGADTNHNQHYIDGGFTYLINDNIQWDISAGLGLNDAADDYFIGSGLSIRWL